LVAALVLAGLTEKTMQLIGAPVSIGWIPWKLPQGGPFRKGAALYLIVFLSYLTVGIVSKQVEKKLGKEYQNSLGGGLVAGVIFSLLGLLIAPNTQNHSWLTAVLTIFGLLYAIFLGVAVGSVAPEKKLGEGTAEGTAVLLGCGLTLILGLSIAIGPILLLVIEGGLLLVVAAFFGVTKFIRYLDQISVLSRIGRWLIAG